MTLTLPTEPIYYTRIRIPTQHFGLPTQYLDLPHPVTQPVAEAATDAFLHHHTHACTPCVNLNAAHRGFHPPLRRTLAIIGTVGITELAHIIAIGTPLPASDLLPTAVLLAVFWIHILIAIGTAAAAIHRRRMRADMLLLIQHAHTEQTRPGTGLPNP